MAVKNGGLARLPFFNKGRKRAPSNEKNRSTSGAPGSSHDGENDSQQDEESNDRSLFFNIPLPQELLDENGAPIQSFPRNKIRTAKYTPLSFIPKNLWFQFHNVANIFFLFLVILVVSASPILVSLLASQEKDGLFQ